ncbi:MAG: hypothetical protein GX025_05980 [Clostridiales bacterium]|nr:hypothetical protein [Clostridiales bacterium]
MDNKVVSRISEILEPTEEQKERMFCNIIYKRKNDTAKKRGISPMKRFKPAIVTAVIAICLITTTAFAAAYTGLDINFLNFLKPSSDEQIEYLANGAYVIDKQVKNKNGTLDIKQVIGDSNVTLILMDFIAPEGTILNKAHYSFENIDIDYGNGFAGYGIVSLEDKNINDNKISLVMRVKTNDSLMGQKFRLKLSNLGSSETWPGELTTSVSGEWKTSFNLDFKNYSMDYQINQAIEMFGYDAIINTISVSPISVAFKLESSFVEQISQAAGNWEVLGENKYSDVYPITINYKDGTSETTDIFNGMSHLDVENILLIKTFESVINDKEIESLTFFGVEIPIIH